MSCKTEEFLVFSDRLITVSGQISKTECPPQVDGAPLVRTLRLGSSKEFPLASLVISRHSEMKDMQQVLRYNLQITPNHDAPLPIYPEGCDVNEGVLLIRDVRPDCSLGFAINDIKFSIVSQKTQPYEFKVATNYVNLTS